MTLAPELPGALDLVAKLSADGVLVSLGHSDATAAEAHAGFDAGARTCTHLFNAMSPLRHRDPGLPGVALTRPDVTVQIIVDGHHLADDVVRLVWAAARGRVVLVTDATEASAREEGEYAIAGVPVEVREGAVRNEQGVLAGSALTLDAAVRNVCALGIDVAEALTAVTATPAALVGRLRPRPAAPRRACRPRRAGGRPARPGDLGRWPAGAGDGGAGMTSFLEREIAEQPAVAARLLDRLLPRLDELRAHLTDRGAEQVLLVARGSSDNAARYAQYLWQTGPGVTVTLAAPSLTTVYARPLDLRRHAVVAVSQSGRSPDVVAVVEQARAAGRPTLAVTNDPASPLAEAAELVLDLGAGEERSVAATKTYTSSVLALAVLGCALGEPGALPVDDLRRVPDALDAAVTGATGVERGRRADGVGRPRGLRRPRAEPLHRARDGAQGHRADRHPGGAVLPGRPDARPGRRGRSARARAARRPRRAGERQRARGGARAAPPGGPGRRARVRPRRRTCCVVGLPATASLPGWLTPLTSVVLGQQVAWRAAVRRGVDVDRPGDLSKVTLTR